MNTIGHTFKVTLFGSSHGDAVGCVLDGVPPGLIIDIAERGKHLGQHLRPVGVFTQSLVPGLRAAHHPALEIGDRAGPEAGLAAGKPTWSRSSPASGTAGHPELPSLFSSAMRTGTATSTNGSRMCHVQAMRT